LTSKNNEFRNDVIHRGKIPNRSEAVAYGEAVLSVVRPALSVAKQRFANGVNQLVAQHLIRTHQTLKPGARVATSCMPTILSLSRGEAAQLDGSLEKALASLGAWKLQPHAFGTQ
jgi:ABC-type phosphate transport system permease subunit